MLLMVETWHQHQKNKNKNDLIAVGKGLFLERGFFNISIKDVCALAGISRVTFYKHFQSMDELIFEVQMDILESMTSALEGQCAEMLSGREKLQLMLEAWVEFAEQNPAYIKFILLFDLHYGAYDTNKELKTRYESFIRERKEQNFLIGSIIAGINDGSLQPNLEPLETGQFIFTAMMGLLQKQSLGPLPNHPDRTRKDAFEKRLIEVIMNSVTAENRLCN